MAHMTLPAAHHSADARLAERVGRTLGLQEIHVFWTLPDPPPEPARRPEPPAGATSALTALGALVERVATRLLSRH